LEDLKVALHTIVKLAKMNWLGKQHIDDLDKRNPSRTKEHAISNSLSYK
jgi:hypothetical protein